MGFKSRIILWLIAFFAVTSVPLLFPWKAAAGVIELSAGFGFDKTTYSPGSYTWTRRWTGSVAYYFTEISSIELGFQDSINRNNIPAVEDTTFHDRVISVNWVQHFTGTGTFLQPYVKAGVGQLNRDAKGSFATGGSPPLEDDSVIAILGAGLKIRLSSVFGLRGEATTYLDHGHISTWKDNVSATAGVSFYF